MPLASINRGPSVEREVVSKVMPVVLGTVAVGAGDVAVGALVEVGGDVGVAVSPVHAANRSVATRVSIRAGLSNRFRAVIVLLKTNGTED